MTAKEIKADLTAVREELNKFTFTGVDAARSIVGMANLLDKCISEIKEEQSE